MTFGMAQFGMARYEPPVGNHAITCGPELSYNFFIFFVKSQTKTVIVFRPIMEFRRLSYYSAWF